MYRHVYTDLSLSIYICVYICISRSISLVSVSATNAVNVTVAIWLKTQNPCYPTFMVAKPCILR